MSFLLRYWPDDAEHGSQMVSVFSYGTFLHAGSRNSKKDIYKIRIL